MSKQRETRCISAAFGFLNSAEFCPTCIHGYDSASKDVTSSTTIMKKSDSDPVSLDCQEKNLRNTEKMKVCLCQSTDISQNGSNPPGELNRVIPDEEENTDKDVEHEGGSVGETGVSSDSVCGDAVNPSLEDGVKSQCTISSQGHSCAADNSTSVNAEGCELSSDNTDPSCPEAAETIPEDDAGDGEADDVVEVEMRPNRHSLHRRSTNTAVISSAFGFLPASVNTVFEPLAESDCRNSDQMSDAQSSDCLTQDTEKQTSSDVSDSDVNGCQSEEGESSSEVRMRRSRLSKQDSVPEEEGSGDSSDEDAGVYSEGFRRSNWIRIDDNGELELAFPAVDSSRLSAASRSSASRSSGLSSDVTDSLRTPSPKVTSDEPPLFSEKCPSPRLFHKRSDSTSTTLSEREFKKEYVTRRKCLIQRQNSSKEYHRYSAKVYDEEKSVVLEKGPSESDFGLHILDSEPAYITRVDPGSPADRAGVEEGQILVSVNGVNVLTLCHYDIVALITNNPSIIKIDVATSDFQPSRDLQASVIEGFMQKLGGASSLIMRRWKKRYFVLRQDSCLYYYKQKDDTDPLGAIPLAGYTFSRHLDTGKDFCFKAEKYGARTYYFMTEGRNDMTEWVGALLEAAARSKKRKDSFVSVSSHNVGLPALEIRRPECSGYLLKVGNRHRSWHRRYCILKDACLYYYKNVNSLSALGVAHLHGYKVDPSISIGKKHAFAVIPPDESLRLFQFSAENDTDRQRWVDAMIRSIQRWVQIDHDC